MLGCAEVAVSVGSVATKVGTYQGKVMAWVGFVPTKVGTYQSGVMVSVSSVPTKVGTHQSRAHPERDAATNPRAGRCCLR
ncbi:MAG TPA: hypothetical protein DIW85_04370 [Stenotrophomonas sp.]|jgi:methylthioribose-1-phosphate isomerase|nr:hypothetical protein [Stenotrophomonas sp.]